jgi:hypothetical protein
MAEWWLRPKLRLMVLRAELGFVALSVVGERSVRVRRDATGPAPWRWRVALAGLMFGRGDGSGGAGLALLGRFGEQGVSVVSGELQQHDRVHENLRVGGPPSLASR